MKVYTAAQMREREQAAVDKGTSFDQLMENAGSSAAQDLMQRYPQAGRALIVCGKGNNGGDGLVMARYMQAQGWHIDILFSLGENLSPLAQTNRERLNGLPHIELISAQELEGRLKKGYDIIIEGIFGTGFSGALPTEIAALCSQLNHSNGLKVALDIPTGLNCDTAEADPDTFRADLTYTFAAYKPAHLSESGKTYCQETVCLPIGID
ncbi:MULTISPECIES: NAD(P)H-hydrate epimerase [Neisseria]|jgi:hypothetical protein|uniref:NAD(P)H-hydrate epimerase n=1 Tax=Neisseria TaxID=482 RepID=UPI0008A44C3F|nr:MULTISPECIES: NAD(P)H-hydrate epimerase [Neisseria]OFQ13699.1 NAD(P)H-hydrate epimerase [Neisseria sp. HMSC068C12]